MGRPKKEQPTQTPDYLQGIEQQPQPTQAASPQDVPSLPGFNPADVRPKVVTKIMPNVASPSDRQSLMSGAGASINVYNKKTGRTVKMNEKAFNRIKRNNPYLSKTHG